MTKHGKLFGICLFVFAYLLLANTVALAATITVGRDGAANYLTSNYANDAACIQAALDNARSGDTIIIRAGTYIINNRLTQYNKNLNIIGEGNVILRMQTAEGANNGLYLSGAIIGNRTLSANAVKGSTQIVLNDASNVRPNDIIKLWKDVKWCTLDYPDQLTGEMYKIKAVSGNTVTLTEPLLRDYPSSISKIIVDRPIEVHVKNICVQGRDATRMHEGIALRYVIDSSVENCQVRDTGLAGISFYSSYNVKAFNNDVRNTILPGSGYGIGIWSGTAHAEIYSNTLLNNRHCVTLNSDERNTLVRGVYVHHNVCSGASIPSSNAIDAHPIALDYIVENNKITVQAGFYAFSDGALISTFANNEVYGGYGGVCRRGNVSGGSHIIKNNVIQGDGKSETFLYRAWGSGTGDTLIIEGNWQSGGRYGVFMSSEQPERYKSIVIKGNYISNIQNQGIYIQLQMDGSNVEITNNTFSNIRREPILVDGRSFRNGTIIIQNNNIGNVSSGTGISTPNISNASVSGNKTSGSSISVSKPSVLDAAGVGFSGNSINFDPINSNPVNSNLGGWTKNPIQSIVDISAINFSVKLSPIFNEIMDSAVTSLLKSSPGISNTKPVLLQSLTKKTAKTAKTANIPVLNLDPLNFSVKSASPQTTIKQSSIIAPVLSTLNLTKKTTNYKLVK